MSHTVIADFKCNAGTGADFIKLLHESLPDTRAFEGCELIEVYSDIENPDRILLFEKWASREKHVAYMAWRVENGMAEMLAPFMSGVPETLHLQVEEG